MTDMLWKFIAVLRFFGRCPPNWRSPLPKVLTLPTSWITAFVSLTSALRIRRAQTTVRVSYVHACDDWL